MVIHRAALNGKPVCLAPHGKVSVSGCVVTCPECRKRESRPISQEGRQVYAVKCDHCKSIMTLTYDIQESYQGGLCRSCNL